MPPYLAVAKSWWCAIIIEQAFYSQMMNGGYIDVGFTGKL
jgi:hypothetical protein|nr:MAG: hypothetical protein [Bacteriophage sp.]